MDIKEPEQIISTNGAAGVNDSKFFSEAEKSLQHTEFEHGLGIWQAVKLYRPAVAWCLLINLAVILSGFDAALVGSLVGVESFREQFGYLYEGEYVINAAWLGALNYAGLVGNCIGTLVAGYSYDKLGPRMTLGACCVASVGWIFMQFFSASVALLFVGELGNGVITGCYPVVAMAYISEVCPVVLRGVITSGINLSFVVGALVAAGILKGTGTIDSKWAYKIPFACQWFLPVVIFALLFWCPTPPYWLVRKGRHEEAAQSLIRLTSKDMDTTFALANIQETLRLEESTEMSNPSNPFSNFTECFRGTNLRRLIICVMVCQLQPLGGNIFFTNYAVYFFGLAGLNASDAFSMNIGLTCLGVVTTILSWPLMSFVGRRTILTVCSGLMAIVMFLIGILDVVPQNNSGPLWAQCAFLVVATAIFDISMGPMLFVILAETSAANVRSTTIALSSLTNYATSTIFAVAIPYCLNTDQANWGGKIGFMFAGLGVICFLWCYFFLPETKGRTFEELDILFKLKVPSRKFKDFVVLDAVGSGQV